MDWGREPGDGSQEKENVRTARRTERGRRRGIDPLRGARQLPDMDQEIIALAEAAGRAANAERVLLFGSQARGDATPESDVDLALIVPDGIERRAALRAAIHATASRRRPLDLVVLSHSTWQRKESMLARQVSEEGVVAYGS